MSEESGNTSIPRSRSMDSLRNIAQTNTPPSLNISTPPTTAKQPGWFKRKLSGAKQGLGNLWSGTKQGLGNLYNNIVNDYGDSIGSGLSTIGAQMLMTSPSAADWKIAAGKAAVGLTSAMLGGNVSGQYKRKQQELSDKKMREDAEFIQNVKAAAKANSGRRRSNSIPYGSSPPNIMGLYTPNVATSGGGRKKLMLNTSVAPSINKPERNTRSKMKTMTKSTAGKMRKKLKKDNAAHKLRVAARNINNKIAERNKKEIAKMLNL